MEKKTDEYCRKIVMVLSIDNKKTRFNELYRKLTKYNAKMSKPTLIEHLNHLIKNKIIQLTQEDKQKVSYEINWKKLEQLQKGIQVSQDIYNHIQNEGTFKSLNLQDQTAFTLAISSISQLFYLRICIDSILEPKNKLQNYYAFTTLNDIYRIYPEWLFDSCEKSKENSQEIILHIDNFIEKILKTIFVTPQKIT